jgi:uncharacterized UPF0160 family protein
LVNMSKKIPRSFGTHSGTFHADEVTACGLLLLFDLIDEDKIVRTRDLSVLATCEYVCDVGGAYDPSRKLFDHHQVEYQGPLSSAGMILAYLKQKDLLTRSGYDYLNNSLILGVDAVDNGHDPQILGFCSFSNVISNFTPISHDTSPAEQDEAFYQALRFTTGHLRRLWGRFNYIQSCRNLIAEEMDKDRSYLIFERSIPWFELFFELGGLNHRALFVVMPSGEHWKLRAIPPTYEQRMKMRYPLPEEWAGLLNEELKQRSGIEGAIFCHKGRFISVWETREDALKALEYTLSRAKTEL